MKKVLSALIVAVMLVGMLPAIAIPAFAEETSGTTGDCTWTLNGTELTISGSGQMETYYYGYYAPWGKSITKVIIEDGVTSIGAFAFYNSTGLTSVIIPDSVTFIGRWAFKGCTGLSSVTIGESVTTIGDSAFSGCTGLTSVTIPDSVTTIVDCAFADCIGLVSIAIGDSVTAIGRAVLNDTAYYNDESNWEDNVLYLGDYLIGAKQEISGSYSIKAGTKLIADGAFYYCTGLTSVTIPDGVTTIGEYAFENCTGLTSAIIGNGATTIGHAFSNCISLTSITIPNSVTTIDGTFFGCIGLTSVTIPDSVTTIDGAFSGCSGLTSVTIPDSVTTIGHGTFSNCTGLTSVTIPDSVTSIESTAFKFCTGLTSVTIPDSVTSIGDDAFYCCTNLTSVVIGERVTSIGDNAFDNTAYYNEESNWEDDVLYLGNYLIGAKEEISGSYFIEAGTKLIADQVFYHCTGLTSVTIPDSVTNFGSSAFYGCTGLTSIVLPNSIIAIDDAAFGGCTGLTSVTIGDSVTSIGDSAFSGCTGLTSVTIPDSVTTIGDSAFHGCTGLTSVAIGDSVTTIGDSAFYGCALLTSVTIGESVANIGSVAFNYTAYYNKESNWEDEVLYLGNYLIGAKEGISGNYSIKAGTKVIADWGFSHCTGLTSVTISDSVTSISDYAFIGCTGLTSITIPYSVTTIDEYAFSGCANLRDVYYLGTQEEFENIFIKKMNEPLTSATIHCQEQAAHRHTYDNACDTTCDCGHIRTVPGHKYTNACDKDCNACGAVRTPAAHKGGTATCKAKAVCTVCGASYGSLLAHKYTNACDIDCNVCKEERSVDPHKYDHACDTECNICKATRTIAHKYDNACDADCNVCGAPRSASHRYVNATCTAPKTCTVCKVTSGSALGHTYDNACDTDCNVCKATRTITHAFGEYIYNEDATSQKDGTQTRTCSVCQKTETVTASGTKLENPFKDVKLDQYYAEPVLWAVGKKITNGMTADSFAPNNECTRGQIVTFLWRAAGSPEPTSTKNPFVDVKSDQYYYKAVLWAVEKGITNGMDATHFAPDATCTRGQVVTFLWRAKGKPAASGSNAFGDVKSGAYYYDAVRWAVKNEITNGMNATSFAPDATCTRGQIVTFLYRAYN